MRRRLYWLVVAVLMCPVVAGGQHQGAAGSSPLGPAPADIEALVRQALEDRLAARGLPDGHLFGAATRIPIREEMPRAAMRLEPGALPRRDGYEFYFVSVAAAQAEADRSKQRVHLIIVDSPQIAGDVATISLGVDLLMPSEPDVMILCCCRGNGQFRRKNDQWTFDKWIATVCS
jgi:hypothetical protein